MTIQEQVKNCPFCNGKAIVEKFIVESNVKCLECRARIVRRHSDGINKIDDVKEVIKAWNTRSQEPKQFSGFYTEKPKHE